MAYRKLLRTKVLATGRNCVAAGCGTSPSASLLVARNSLIVDALLISSGAGH